MPAVLLQPRFWSCTCTRALLWRSPNHGELNQKLPTQRQAWEWEQSPRTWCLGLGGFVKKPSCGIWARWAQHGGVLGDSDLPHGTKGPQAATRRRVPQSWPQVQESFGKSGALKAFWGNSGAFGEFRGRGSCCRGCNQHHRWPDAKWGGCRGDLGVPRHQAVPPCSLQQLLQWVCKAKQGGKCRLWADFPAFLGMWCFRGEKGAGVIVTASAVCQAARILPKITESLRCLLKAAGMMQKNWPRAEVESNYAILL